MVKKAQGWSEVLVSFVILLLCLANDYYLYGACDGTHI